MRFATTIALATAALAAALATAHPARAAQGRNAALIGGLAIGAAGAAILLNRPARAAPVVVEEEYIERPAPRYVPTCRMERRRVWIDSESYTYRRVEVCE
ncbi:hypothetical protein [Rhabdaerophilum sp. SD176]|uniref:hypothetical protein n=1 Tax=Rhabdaerophilum sp. SD176 TaxID=2983548 RepID=UPI0024E0141B|nr:hypothetical protein [Rhabdaerophilum sp. SD176]